MIAAIGAGMAAGLLGSPHCAGMCGGFATACGRVRGGVAAWHAGRLATYAALGALAGGFGAVIPGPVWLPGVLSAVLLLWFAASLAGVVREPAPRFRWIGRAAAAVAGRAGLGWRFVFGVLNGLLPCGMVYAALAIPVALADPLAGALSMLGFGAGTVPALTLLPALLRRVMAGSRRSRRVVAVLVLLAGLVSIGLRTRAALAPAPNPAAHAHRH